MQLYVEPGYTASDSYDGTLTSSVSVSQRDRDLKTVRLEWRQLDTSFNRTDDFILKIILVST